LLLKPGGIKSTSSIKFCFKISCHRNQFQ
jgi:hypothetical protein